MTKLKNISLFLFALFVLGSCSKITPLDVDGSGDTVSYDKSITVDDTDIPGDTDEGGSITDPDDDGDDGAGNTGPGGITDADDDMDDGADDSITDPDDDDDEVIIDDNSGKGGNSDTGTGIIKG